MASPFQRNDRLLGISSFAPEFWRLLAEPAPKPHGAMPKPAPPSAAPMPPQSQADRPDRPLPPLTNDALEALRDSLGPRADSLQDIPPVPMAPYPPFTGYGPPLTSESLRELRRKIPGFGELQNIPLPEYLPPAPTPEYSEQLAVKVKQISRLRQKIAQMEAEKGKRPRSQWQAFDEEIASLHQELQSAEQELADQTKKIHGSQKFRYGET